MLAQKYNEAEGKGVNLCDRRKESSFVCQPLAFPHCHVLFWMRREFNSCDDVVHSTHLDYPLSPLHSIISFFLRCGCMRQCVCVCVCVNQVSNPGLPGVILFFFWLLFISLQIQTNECVMFCVPLDSGTSAQAPLNRRTNPKWKQNSSLTSAAPFSFLSAICFGVFWRAYHTFGGESFKIPPVWCSCLFY